MSKNATRKALSEEARNAIKAGQQKRRERERAAKTATSSTTFSTVTTGPTATVTSFEPSVITGITVNGDGTLPEITVAPAPPAPEPVVQKRPRIKKRMPREFAGAHGYAEKRLAEAIRERAECMGKLAMLNAEIPSLVQIIKALGGSQISIEPVQVNMPIDGASLNGTVPPIPVAQGGAVDFDIPQEELEDQFLPKGGTMGGRWS
jgi:hypothetical protein